MAQFVKLLAMERAICFLSFPLYPERPSTFFPGSSGSSVKLTALGSSVGGNLSYFPLSLCDEETSFFLRIEKPIIYFLLSFKNKSPSRAYRLEISTGNSDG
jgi:hypothetical protein